MFVCFKRNVAVRIPHDTNHSRTSLALHRGSGPSANVCKSVVPSQMNVVGAKRYLLVTPCDPGNCHIYFGVQRRALATAVALAHITGRTLLIPPPEWYPDQAQQFANAFMNSPQGRVPQFVRWSELYDIDRLRQSGVDADDFHDVNIDRIDRAVLATGGAMAKLPASVPSTPNSDDALLGHLQAHPCKHGRTGLQSNFSFEFDSETNAQAGVGELYGRHLRIDALRCGALPLSRTETQKALAAWLGDVPIAAVFDVGHHAHTIVSDMKVFVKLDQGLRPSALLDREAARFIHEMLLARGASKFAAVHWRHGDYVPSVYNMLTPLESVVKRVRKALNEELECPDCPVLLMTNCRNESALAELRAALPTLVRYTPLAPPTADDYRSWAADDVDATPRTVFSDEGPRLLIEQAIAMRADAFVGNPRSAVTEFVDMVRHSRNQQSRPKMEL